MLFLKLLFVFRRRNKMNESDIKKSLYHYWDTSSKYYEIAESIHKDIDDRSKELFTLVKEGSKVLDVACGSGVNRKNLPKNIFYCGIDLSFAGLSYAKQLGTDNSFIKADAERLPLTNGSFDYIISTNAVEHFINPKLIFDEMWRVCKEGGCILLIFPNFGDYIFNYPPSIAHAMSKMPYKTMYIFRQFYRQTMRILFKRIFFFAKIDVAPGVLLNSYSPDNDVMYLASGREVTNYFEMRGASVTVMSKNKLSFVAPFLRNFPRNIFRFYKTVNPYYEWHGDSILVIRKQGIGLF